MSGDTKLISRIALLSALIYVLSWGTSFLPNVNLAFFIAFLAGYLWGAVPGALVGGIGMWLWTSLNPFGPAVLPVSIAQVAGMAACGLVGSSARQLKRLELKERNHWLALMFAGLICTLVFYLPVTLVDAWVFQPFWPRFVTGLLFMGISLAANVVVFPLLFGVTARLRERETAISC